MKINRFTFLKDVFLCSLGAFGGPEAHYGIFNHQLVKRKKYLTEEELYEYMGLTSVLPGPSSTQTIIAIGVQIGGPILGFLTFLVWALPIIIILTIFAVMVRFLNVNVTLSTFRISLSYIAIGFVFYAGLSMAKKTFETPLRIGLTLITLFITYFFRMTYLFPLLLIIGGVIHSLFVKMEPSKGAQPVRVSWIYLGLFLGLLGTSLFFIQSEMFLAYLFGQFYLFGSLVIGGGQVVIPYMVETLVNDQGLLSLTDFLAGLGLVQGLPGPMFSFAAYAGGVAALDQSLIMQVASSLISALGLFLPGILLLYFAFPLFNSFKRFSVVKSALLGITSVATGLVLSTGATLFINTSITLTSFVMVLLTLGLLYTQKIPAPILVLIVLGFGALVI